MRRVVIGNLVWIMMLSVSLAVAGQPEGGPPGQNKLPAPENVVCPVVDGLVEVSWDDVEGAQGYQVEYVGLSVDTPAVEESVFVLGPPVDIELAPFGAVISRVRALPGPKKPGNPPQSGGPKGIWSDPCVVILEAVQLPELPPVPEVNPLTAPKP
jgi:hypothetical protein